PSGAPPVAHLTIVSRSASLRRRSFRNSPCAGSACHGGIVPFATRVATDLARTVAVRAVPVKDRRDVLREGGGGSSPALRAGLHCRDDREHPKGSRGNNLSCHRCPRIERRSSRGIREQWRKG